MEFIFEVILGGIIGFIVGGFVFYEIGKKQMCKILASKEIK